MGIQSYYVSSDQYKKGQNILCTGEYEDTSETEP